MNYLEKFEQDMETASKTLEELCKKYGIDIDKIPELKEAFSSAIMNARDEGSDKIDVMGAMAEVVKEVIDWSRVKEVKSVDESLPVRRGMIPTGQFVSIRPCGDEYEGKTYLGIFLGDMPLGLSANLVGETVEVKRSGYNPAILIPSKKKIVFGCESWWGAIKKPEDLEQITDEDIDNVWYVKAIKSQWEKEVD